MARLAIKIGPGRYTFCGASLIEDNFLLTAKHCVQDFYNNCNTEKDCTAYFRDLIRGRTHHEEGEFTVPIVDAFIREGRSDLAVLQLKFPVQEHPDYHLGPPLRPIGLALQAPQVGQVVTTAGWGVTGYNQGRSQELRSLQLTIAQVTAGHWHHGPGERHVGVHQHRDRRQDH